MSDNANLSALLSVFEDELEEQFEEVITNVEAAEGDFVDVIEGSSARKSPDVDKHGKQFASADHAVFDPTFGIRIRNPKVTLQMLNTYCHDMKKLRASGLRRLGAPNSGEWVTMVVIVAKTECRKSANNKEYIIWQVSDLSEIQDMPIKVLLFGDCIKQHWKLQAGMTVLLVNPSLADSELSKLTLKVSKAAQVIEIGFCPDLGTCKAVKVDGNPCNVHVNITKTEYCVYHMQNAARKLSARRGTFGSSSNIPPKAWRALAAAPVEPMPDGLKTTSRGGPIKKFVKAIPRHMKSSKMLPVAGSPASPTPDQLLRNRVRTVQKESGVRKRGESFDPQQSSEPPIKRVKSMKEFIHSQENKPNLGSRANLGFVDLASPEKKMKSRNELHEQIKLKKAAEILRRTASQPAGEQGARRKLANCGDASTSKPSDTFTDDQIKALINRKSIFQSEAAEALQDRQNRYFADREVEEKVESSATSLMEIKNCKVVTCVACNYTSIHQSDYCRSLGHLVKRHTADKRFFRCKNCKTRISCFKLLPTKPCQSCLMIDYERVTMRDERKIHEEKLLLRGEERKFIN